jgi:Uma2 family endonuclease
MVAMPVLTDTGTLVPGPPQGRWTYADWEKLPDDGNRYEIIDGVLYMTTAPSNFHQWIIKYIYKALGAPAEERGLAEAAWSPIGVIMPGCDPVQPDFILIRKENLGIVRDARVHGVPDLIVEVISPGSRAFDEDLKLTAYANAGVPEYAVIDPKARVLRYYKLIASGKYSEPQQFGVGESITFDTAPGIMVPIAALFEGAPDTTL